MKGVISVVLPAHLSDIEDNLLEGEKKAAQLYFDETNLDLGSSSLYFVPLKSIYLHISRKMTITGAILNCHGKSIEELAATIRMSTNIEGMEIATMKIALPPYFLGCLQPNHALLLNLSAPTRGLNEDRIFEAFELSSKLDDVKIIEALDKEVNVS